MLSPTIPRKLSGWCRMNWSCASGTPSGLCAGLHRGREEQDHEDPGGQDRGAGDESQVPAAAAS